MKASASHNFLKQIRIVRSIFKKLNKPQEIIIYKNQNRVNEGGWINIKTNTRSRQFKNMKNPRKSPMLTLCRKPQKKKFNNERNTTEINCSTIMSCRLIIRNQSKNVPSSVTNYNDLSLILFTNNWLFIGKVSPLTLILIIFVFTFYNSGTLLRGYTLYLHPRNTVSLIMN